VARKAKRMKRKTHRGVAKRFKISAGGKVLRPHSGKRHLMGTKKPSRMRRLRKGTQAHPADAANIRHMLPYA